MRIELIEIGNLKPPRKNFDSPQESRVYYGGGGISPCLRAMAGFDQSPKVILLYEE